MYDTRFAVLCELARELNQIQKQGKKDKQLKIQLQIKTVFDKL